MELFFYSVSSNLTIIELGILGFVTLIDKISSPGKYTDMSF
jgi:hypothetical protein